MNPLSSIVAAVVPVFLLAGIGVLLRRRQWLTPEADASLMRLVVSVLTPALVFHVVLGNQALRQVENLFMAPLMGFLEVAIGVGIAWLFRRASGLATESSQRTFAAVTGIQNFGYVPLPLVLTLFPGDAAGMLFVHNLGVDIAMWTVCLVALGHAGIHEWRHLLNPPVVSIVAAVGLNAVGARRWIPDSLLATAQMLGVCAFPLGIVLIGATIADSGAALRQRIDLRTILWSSLVRLGLMPLLILAAAWLLPVEPELKQVLVVQAAMPVAIFPIVLARLHGGDPLTAVRIVVGSSLLGLVTIPLWLKLGLRLLGG